MIPTLGRKPSESITLFYTVNFLLGSIVAEFRPANKRKTKKTHETQNLLECWLRKPVILRFFWSKFVTLAIFDLDETLIGIDSDHAWGEYVADQGLVDAETHKAENQKFFDDYKQGQLDINAYFEFSCRVLTMHPVEELQRHRARFIEEIIRPHVLPKAEALVAEERAAGKHVMIVTATMEFVTRPIADIFGIDHLIAPIPERRPDGTYTGAIEGVASYGAGKVTRLQAWLNETGHSLTGSRFYSDSHNDLPLLELVAEPFAVDPDERLEKVATERGWQCISLR